MRFALNHMTVARMGYAELLQAAERLGCTGVEVRNDLPVPLFDGRPPDEAGAMARDRGLRLLAVAEVKRFNDWSADTAAAARSLMAIARDAGAEAVALIPRNDNLGIGEGERQANLRRALRELAPMLADHGLMGFVEPLGFPVCALRHKADAAEAIADLGVGQVFRIVHDTFHHALAGGGPLYPDLTGIVHVSGVVDPAPATDALTDAHRVLVDGEDRLGNVAQLAALGDAGYAGPVSFECFAPSVHALADPVAAIGASIRHIEQGLARRAA